MVAITSYRLCLSLSATGVGWLWPGRLEVRGPTGHVLGLLDGGNTLHKLPELGDF
jgi:hypothetical protein